MSNNNKNYNNYRNNYNANVKEQKPVKEEVIKEIKVAELIEEEVVEETITTSNEPISAFVANCSKLNVRKQPSKDSAIVCVIDASTELIIIEEESTDEWYKVILENAVEGFCMKKFIELK